MLRLTLAQMRSSVPRLVAACVAILLGSAFVTAGITAGDAITRGGYDAVTASYGRADIIVDPGDVPLLDATETARDNPGVTAADPLLVGSTSFTNDRRTEYQRVLPTTSSPALSSLTVTEGVAPATGSEVALPASTAERLGVDLGDTFEASWTQWPTQEQVDAAQAAGDDAAVEPLERTAPVTLVGIVEDPYGAWAESGGAGLAVTDSVITWSGYAATPENMRGTVLVATDGDVQEVMSSLREQLPDSWVLTRDEAAIRTVEQMGAGDVIRTIALGFAAIALLVAGLVISNTFQVLVAQRTRMLALLRCVGAQRRQLRRSVLLEAGTLGAVAGLAGVLLGLGLTQAALSILARTQDDVPLPQGVQPTLTSVLVPVLVSTAVTLVAALVPARAATQVSPVAALRPADAPTVHGRRGRARLALSLLMVLGGAALMVGMVLLARTGGDVDQIITVSAAMLGGGVSFVGLLVGAPLWIPRVMSVVGRPVGRTGATARLAVANTVRNPRRTAATSAALVIGVTLVMTMSTGALTAQTSLARAMDERDLVDLVAVGGEEGSISQAGAARLAEVDGVVTAVATRQGTVTTEAGDEWEALVLDPADAGVLRDRGAGDVVRAGRSVVPEAWGAGRTTVPMTAGRTADVEVTARGTSSVLLTAAAAQQVGLEDAGTVPALLMRLEADADHDAIFDALREVIADDGVMVVNAAAQRQSEEAAINVLLTVVVALLGVAVLIALVGVANTLSLSVIERRRESGTLRAVGMSRRSLRRMLATEGLLIAGVGALIGIVLGLLYGWAGAAAMFGQMGDVELAVPWAHIGAAVAVALVAGLGASVLPARTAARTPPVAALAVD